MARYFLDSSALVKRYHQESGTAEIEGLFDTPGNHLLVSRLALVELHSSFARLVREGILTESGFDLLVAGLDADVASGALTIAAVSGRRLEGASVILRNHGVKYAIRTLDAIQLATAQALHSRTNIAAFVAADKKLLAAATGCGFAVRAVG